MNGFLDRVAARAVGEAPLMQPRLRSRFEPDSGVQPEGPVEPAQELAEVSEVAAVSRVEIREPVAEDFPVRSALRRREQEPSPGVQPEVAEAMISRPRVDPARMDRPRIGPAPLDPPRIGMARIGAVRIGPPQPRIDPTRVETQGYVPAPPGEAPPPDRPVKRGATALPVAVDGSTDRGEGEAVERPVSRLTPPAAVERQPLRLRPRTTLAAELPTVDPDRRAPLPSSLEEGEPDETVVHVSIGRIDVRTSQPPAPERRPARSSGPRLTLADYLKRREERR